MTDRELERLLQIAASDVRYPSAADLTDGVLARISAPASQHEVQRRAFLAPATAMLFAALVLSVVLVITASPAGDAIARFFGVEGSRVERLPPAPPGATATPFPNSEGLGANVQPMSLAEAAAAAGFAPGLPSGLGGPREVYLVQYGSQAVVVLRYDRFDLWQAQLQQNASFGKQVPPEGVIQEVSVRGEPATWLTGAPHFVSYILPSGQELRESARTVDKNTLIWRTARAFYRMETDLSLEEALRLAASLP
ncbi:MAG: hypothetical protein GEU75_10570 [Dehalococcoidia bacterium]|nr:hypothetical protein [Dehalococcoidia bacterium]